MSQLELRGARYSKKYLRPHFSAYWWNGVFVCDPCASKISHALEAIQIDYDIRGNELNPEDFGYKTGIEYTCPLCHKETWEF